jgi:hypothetical protein
MRFSKDRFRDAAPSVWIIVHVSGRGFAQRYEEDVAILFIAPDADKFDVKEKQIMTKSRKVSFQKTLKLISGVVEGQLSKLPPKAADSKRKKIHQIALNACSNR